MHTHNIVPGVKICVSCQLVIIYLVSKVYHSRVKAQDRALSDIEFLSRGISVVLYTNTLHI